MLTTFEDVVIVVCGVVLSLLFVWMLQRFWPSSQRRMHNDIIGWQVTVLGTTYAVIMGFMLYAVWSAFQSAEINAGNEANCLVNVFRLADGLPETQKHQVHQLVREYADIVVVQEWPTMHKGELGLEGNAVVEKLWATVVQAKPVTFAEQTSMSLTLTEISNMTRYRRVRELQSESELPAILWFLMILGGIITILSASLFGTENFKLHLMQVLALTLMISLTLVTIADIDRPFQGTVHVRPLGFQRARDTLARFPIDTQ
jgi:hypothetical protein